MWPMKTRRRGRITFGVCRAIPANRPDGIAHLVVNVWWRKTATSNSRGVRIFAAEERQNAPGWIAVLLAGIEAGEPTAMLLDYIRDHGLTPEMESVQ